MRGQYSKRRWLSALCLAVLALGVPGPASAAPPEPDFVFFPKGTGLEGPCGLAVDPADPARLGNPISNLYVADYYHHVISVFDPAISPNSISLTQVPGVDPLDGPCGLAVARTGAIYVNNYHRSVVRYVPSIYPPTAATKYDAGTTIDASNPTGVAVDPGTGNVYVNARTYIAAYGPTGAPILDGGGQPLKIGLGSLGDGYGLAFSEYPATSGLLYVADGATNTVKAYNSNPALNTVNPVMTISGPGGGFVSLDDSAVAVDRVTGEIYVADNLEPQYAERPEAMIHVFTALGGSKGRLKYNIVDALPPGLTVDNSTKSSQGRVFVTSGNTIQAAIYIYPPGSATNLSSPATFSLTVTSRGDGDGSIASELVGIDCAAACEERVRAGGEITLGAKPEPGSAFAGWSGGGCSGTGACVVEMSEARSVSAEFTALRSSTGSVPRSVATSSGIAQKGTLRVTVDGKLSPRVLPRNATAPIAVSIGGKITTTDTSQPPQLQTLRIELNRHGRLDTIGLPVCAYGRIQPASTARALAACRAALVGRGSFTANIALAGQEPYPTSGQLLVFNGRRHGEPVLFGQIYAPKPFATSFVIVFTVQKLHGGTYGTALNADLPEALGSWGNLTGIEMTLSRRYSHRGSRHSYLSAGCPAPKGFPGAVFPLARTSFGFAGKKKLTSVFTDSCKVKGGVDG